MSQVHWLDGADIGFPPTHSALTDPDGLLAVGGDLTPERIVNAYSLGIFPWYSEGQPLLWWTPNPRLVLDPEHLHLGRSTRKLLRKQPFKITVDQNFETVMRHCGTIPRKEQDGSWITEEMVDAYKNLHDLGVAHSVEVWQHDELVGGLYGLALGRVYFGESMFSLVSGASRVAFATLATQLQAWGFELIDCQIHSDYLESFGAKEVSREHFESHLLNSVAKTPRVESLSKPWPVQAKQKQISIFDWREAWQMPEHGFDGS
ncbi:leucyl/phenylalanyl-tRNA--protein transferase [Alteromonadaceae bacterium Bs31]|nr:leucyl/phenylalanyl-tRNA--protein transferase [Alteromonadaceae bacterium Bs31]